MTPEERLFKPDSPFKHYDEAFETLLEAGFEPTPNYNSTGDQLFKDAYNRKAIAVADGAGHFWVKIWPRRRKGPLVAMHPFTDSGEAQHYADTNRGAGYSARVFSRRLRADGEWIDIDVVVVRRKI